MITIIITTTITTSIEISVAFRDISFMPSKNILETLVRDNGEATGGFNERVTYFTNKVTTKELPLIRFQTCYVNCIAREPDSLL